MRSVLESALNERVISESPHQRTGGAYQTIRFGDRVRKGFRMSRENLLAGFELAGRSVCDLGANLGEISRELRRAGASPVDAYEYDEFFTQLGRYITAFNGVTDINHFQADVSEPGFMRSTYDICVGLSAFSFMGQNIDYICGQVSNQMIIETHEVTDADWPARYVAPIHRHFPHWCCFGSVTHGRSGTDHRRLWLAFSKESLLPFYNARARSVVPDAEGLIDVDLERSAFPFLDEAATVLEHAADPLSTASLRTYSERLDAHEKGFASGEPTDLSLNGEPYWLALMCGIARFTDRGELDQDNVYLRWMVRGIKAGVVDPGLKPLLGDAPRLHRQVSLRLEALARAVHEKSTGHFIDLPIAYNVTPYHPALGGLHLKVLAIVDSGERLCVSLLNGHHRLFVMKLLGVATCPMVTVWSPQRLNEPLCPTRPVANYEDRIYQYLAGVEVEDPIVSQPDRGQASQV